MKPSIIFLFRRIMLLVLFAVIVAGFQNCSVIRVVQVESPTVDRAASGQQFGNRANVTNSLWRGKNRYVIGNVCPNSAISRFKVTTKPHDVILGFLSLGFAVHQRIEWDCAQRTGSSEIEFRKP